MKAATAPNRLITKVTDQVSVSYDRQFNLVEVAEGNKVIQACIVPDGYTLRQFSAYVIKVQQVYTGRN